MKTTIFNQTTNERLEVANVSIIANSEQLLGRYQFGTRFFNKFGHALEQVGTNDEGQPILSLKEGWKIDEASKPRKHRKPNKPATQPEPETTPTESEPEEMPTETAPEATEATQPTAPATPSQPTASPVPTMDAAVQAFSALTPLFAGVQANVEAAIMQKVQPILDRAPQIITHVIKVAGHEDTTSSEVFHANFDDVASDVANGVWVYLYGPTGSGKNVLAEQVARHLGLDFHYQAHTLDRFELTGFIDANGNYQPTEFYKAYTEGGLFMLDELDASDENALITLNSAANGYFAFPCGTVKAHPNFRCIAAGNTCGRGATDDYTARRVMDASSLGRFVPRFHGYCPEIDLAAAGGNNELVTFFEQMRVIKRSTGVQMILSPRQIKVVVSREARGINLSQTLTDILVAYLTTDEVNIIKQAVRGCDALDGNKYAQAFMKVQAVEY